MAYNKSKKFKRNTIYTNLFCVVFTNNKKLDILVYMQRFHVQERKSARGYINKRFITHAKKNIKSKY